MEQWSKLRNDLPPKGFSDAASDLDVEVFEYDGYIAGLVSSYLAGKTLTPADIQFGEELDRKLEKCMEIVLQLRAYKNAVTEIARTLAKVAQSEPRMKDEPPSQ